MKQNINCNATIKGTVSGKNLLEILAAKFKFKLKFVSPTLFIFKGKLAYLGTNIKY